MGLRLTPHAKVLLALGAVFLLTLLEPALGALQRVILEGEGSAEGNATLKVFLYTTPTAPVPILATSAEVENGTWQVRLTSSRLEYDAVYWLDYRLNGRDVDWGIRERKPLLIHESRVVQFLGSWLWELQVIVDLMGRRLEELAFIEVFPTHASFTLPVALGDSPPVERVVSDPSAYGEASNRSLVSQQYVDALIENLPKTFLELGDTPPSYEGWEGYFVRVNREGTGLEFARPPSGGGPGEASLPTLGPGEVAYGGEDGAITSSPALVYNTTLGVNKTLEEISGSIYALDVGGYANARPSCIAMVLRKDLPVEAKDWKAVEPFVDLFAVVENTNPHIFFVDERGVFVGEPGHYQVEAVMTALKIREGAGFALTVGGDLKGPFQIPLDGSHAYTHLVALDRPAYVGVAVYGSYTLLAVNPYLRTKEPATWLYICKVN